MRLSTLYIAIAVFSHFVDLSRTPVTPKNPNKRDREPEVNAGTTAATAIGTQTTDEVKPAKKKPKKTQVVQSINTPLEDTNILTSSVRSTASGVSLVSSAASPRPVIVDKNDLLNVLLSGRQTSAFNNKIDAIGVKNMPADIAHELMITCMANKKDINLKHMLSQGYRFVFDHEPNEIEIRSLIQAIKDEKVDFISLFLDSDPIGAMKLLIAAYNSSPLEKVDETLKNTLKKSGSFIDPEAIKLAAMVAAEFQSFVLFNVIFESDLMASMIPRSMLLRLFSTPPNPAQAAIFSNLLRLIINERRLTPPYEMSLLSLAATEDNMDFLRSIEPYLYYFSWDVVVQAITIALKKRNYNFIDIVLRVNNYTKVDFVYRLVSQVEFTKVIGEYANFYTMDKLAHTVYREGLSLLIVDLDLMRICMRAAEFGNMEVIDFMLRKQYFNLNTRFKGKSIFRIALENGRADLVKYIIKVFNYSIYDSDTPTVNPPDWGGDSLIYIAKNSLAGLFGYLLRIGANPNVKVIHEGKYLNLVYWCMLKGQDKLVRLLLDFQCGLDANLVQIYNTNPSTMATINYHISQTRGI